MKQPGLMAPKPLPAFFRLTIPLLTPVLLFNVTITMINTLQEFDSIVALTNGGPRRRQPEVS